MRRCRRVTVVGCKSHLTSGVSVHPENFVTYTQQATEVKNCGVFSETATLQRFSTPSIESHGHFPVNSTHAHNMHADNSGLHYVMFYMFLYNQGITHIYLLMLLTIR